MYILLAWLLFGFGESGLITAVFLYAVSLIVAFSPLGEWILRLINGTRPLKTQEEIIKLMPIFEEVYSKAVQVNKGLKKNIRLHITSDVSVNAFALGRGTIAITEGAIETLDEKELRGIIAHEFGHISNGDTKALLISVVGNGVFSFAALLIKGIFKVLEFMMKQTGTGAYLLVNGMQFIFNCVMFVISYIGQIILSINSRQNEYNADKFAFDCGYGNDLLDVLYVLHKFSVGHKVTLREKLTGSHPHLSDRIQRLENYL